MAQRRSWRPKSFVEAPRKGSLVGFAGRRPSSSTFGSKSEWVRSKSSLEALPPDGTSLFSPSPSPLLYTLSRSRCLILLFFFNLSLAFEFLFSASLEHYPVRVSCVALRVTSDVGASGCARRYRAARTPVRCTLGNLQNLSVLSFAGSAFILDSRCVWKRRMRIVPNKRSVLSANQCRFPLSFEPANNSLPLGIHSLCCFFRCFF